MPSPIASSMSYLGIAKEVTPGTAVAATNYIPVTDMKPTIKVMYLPDQALRGSQAKTYGEVQGVTYAEYEFSGSVYADSIGWAIVGVLGDLTVTGASAPFTHAAALLNTTALAPTYTLTDFNGFNSRQFAGFRFSEVTFKFTGDGTLDYTAKGISRTFGTVSNPTPSFTAIPMYPGWLGISSIAGSASSLITDGEVTIKRTVAPIHNVDGAQGPYDIFNAGDLEVTGSLTAVYQDDVILANYTGGSVVALDFNWTQGAAAALTQFKLHMTNAQMDEAAITRANNKQVELAIKFTAIANSTDVGASAGYSPIKVTLQNALASGTYK